jgi:hypothetical protein
MPRWGVWLAGFAACLLAGCVSDRQGSVSTWSERFRALNHGKTGNVVQIDVALIERPIGDSVLNSDIWSADCTDEQILNLDMHHKLWKNGFRIGQIVGPTPSNLYQMLTSERCCANPRRMVVEEGKTAIIRLGAVVARCKYTIDNDGVTTTEELLKAHPSLAVVPTITPEGNTLLRFVPKMEFGESISDFHAAKDRDGWVMEIHRDSKSYPELGWEITLPPNKFLIIGTWLDRPETLGSQSLIDRDSHSPVQRVLALRTTHSGLHGEDGLIAPTPDGGSGTQFKGMSLADYAKMSGYNGGGK